MPGRLHSAKIAVPVRPRILTRYILREILGYALLGGLLFTFVLLIRYLLPLLELFVRGVATPLDLLKLFGYLLPNFLTLTLPMAVLIGILLGLSRLAADSEITAMRASGVGVTTFLRIVSLLAVAAWLFGLYNALSIAPRATRALLHYEEAAKTTQASIAIQPRVFYEDLKSYVLYVQDVMPGSNGSALWKHVFLADLSHPTSPHIITAHEAVVLGGGGQTLHLELADGARHDSSAAHPDQYDLSTFSSTDLPVQMGQQEDTQHLTRRDTPLQALPTRTLWTLTHLPAKAAQPYRIEFQRRLATPTACLVLMLVGVPLGLSSKRGGKGAAFVLTLLIVFLYYFASTMGIALARDGKLPAVVGVWAANVLFAAAGLWLVQQMSTGGATLAAIASLGAAIRRPATRKDAAASAANGEGFGRSSGVMQRARRALRARFPLILDEYVMGSFLRNFALVLLAITVLFMIFTFFELIGDIVRYRTPLVTVGDYLLNLIPFILYNMTPLCSLVAVLITFGTLSRTSELTAMKATGSLPLCSSSRPYLPLPSSPSTNSTSLRPTAGRKPCSPPSRASPRKPSSALTASGSPARTHAWTTPRASSTTNSSIPTKTSSPISPSLSSNPGTSLSRVASSRAPPTGTRKPRAGSSTTAGSAPSQAKPPGATAPLTSPPSLKYANSPATSKKKNAPRRR